MSTEITITESRPEVLSKMHAWATMGRTIHDANMQFQARAQKIIEPLKIMPTKENVLETETALKTAKKESEALDEDILKITRKFDAVCNSLRLSKKITDNEITTASAALLKIKQDIKKMKNRPKQKKTSCYESVKRLQNELRKWMLHIGP